jgi:hypothetical protein
MKRRPRHPFGSALLLAAGLMPATGRADTIIASAPDAEFETGGGGAVIAGPTRINDATVFVGRRYYETGMKHFVVPFQLPDLGEGSFSEVSVSFNVQPRTEEDEVTPRVTPVNLWGIPGSRPTADTQQGDVNNGTENHTGFGALIKSGFLGSGSNGTVSTGEDEEAALAAWLNAAYQNGENAYDNVFMRLSPAAHNPNDISGYSDGDRGFEVRTANSGLQPVLSYTFTPAGPNKPVINSFTITPGSITAGTSATLAWDVTDNGLPTTVTIDQGVGTVVLSGTQLVSPSSNTTYTLSAVNSDGSSSASATITVQISLQAVTLNSHNDDAAWQTNSQGVVSGGPIQTHPAGSNGNSISTQLFIGRYYYGFGSNHFVVPFQLPTDLGPGGFTNVRLHARPAKPSTITGTQSGDPNFNVNVFALPGVRSAPTTLSSDVNDGVSNHLSRGTLIMQNWWTPAGPWPAPGTRATTPDTGAPMENLSAWLTDAYSNGMNAGKWVFIRLSPDLLNVTDERSAYMVNTNNAGNASNRPILTADFSSFIAGPPGITFSANPGTVDPGDPAELSWSIVGADEATITFGNTSQSINPASGTLIVNPTANTTYTLSATGAGGTRTATVEVAVFGPGPYRHYRFVPTRDRAGGTPPGIGGEDFQIAEFQMILDGQWIQCPPSGVTCPGASRPLDHGEGALRANDNRPIFVAPNQPGNTSQGDTKWNDSGMPPLQYDFGSTQDVTGYRICTANDSPNRDPVSWRIEGSHDGGTWVVIDEKINYPTTTSRNTYLEDFTIAPFTGGPVVTFSAAPSSVVAGDPVTLTWDAGDATSVEIDNGVGSVAAPAGSTTVHPAATTTYTLSATNAGGTSTKSATITVVLGYPLHYSFEEGDPLAPSFQGWTNVGGHPWSVTDGHGNARSAPGFVRSTTHDSAHATMILRSPEFTLNGNGDLSVYLGGGQSRTSGVNGPVANLPTFSVHEGGFMGAALRKVATDEYIISLPKSTGGQSPGDESSRHAIAAATLNALLAADSAATYTLDIIDANHGGWGWTVADDVTIPGNLLPPATTPYELWAASKGLAGADAAFDADPDGDGIPNGIEFITNGEPNPANPGALQRDGLPVVEMFGDHLVVIFTRADAAIDLDPHIEFTTNPAGPWTRAVHGANATIQVTDNGPTDTVEVFIPMGDDPAKFARLRVVAP